MNVLSNIFAPIVDIDPSYTLETLFNKSARREASADDKKIVVAFDIMGTLVNSDDDPLRRSEYKPNLPVSRFASDLIKHKDKLGIEVAFISSDPYGATEALHRVKLGKLLDHSPVENKVLFYGQRNRKNMTIIAVDDDIFQSLSAEAAVDPKSNDVKEYLKARSYLPHLEAV